jgi:hypothetical protein
MISKENVNRKERIEANVVRLFLRSTTISTKIQIQRLNDVAIILHFIVLNNGNNICSISLNK